MFFQRIFMREKALNNALIDDGHGRGAFIVRFRDSAAAKNRLPMGGEILGGDAVPRGAGMLVELRQWMTLHDDQLAPVIGERVIEGEPFVLDTGQYVKAVFDLSIQRLNLRLRVGRRRRL